MHVRSPGRTDGGKGKWTYLFRISCHGRPAKEESIQAVADAKRAGIRTIMITGDHKITAVAIAKRIGIYEEGTWH